MGSAGKVEEPDPFVEVCAVRRLVLFENLFPCGRAPGISL
jgi:hypothetical protein